MEQMSWRDKVTEDSEFTPYIEELAKNNLAVEDDKQRDANLAQMQVIWTKMRTAHKNLMEFCKNWGVKMPEGDQKYFKDTDAKVSIISSEGAYMEAILFKTEKHQEILSAKALQESLGITDDCILQQILDKVKEIESAGGETEGPKKRRRRVPMPKAQEPEQPPAIESTATPAKAPAGQTLKKGAVAAAAKKAAAKKTPPPPMKRAMKK